MTDLHRFNRLIGGGPAAPDGWFAVVVDAPRRAARCVGVRDLIADGVRRLAAGLPGDEVVVGLYPDEDLARDLAADLQAEFDAP